MEWLGVYQDPTFLSKPWTNTWHLGHAPRPVLGDQEAPQAIWIKSISVLSTLTTQAEANSSEGLVIPQRLGKEQLPLPFPLLLKATVVALAAHIFPRLRRQVGGPQVQTKT